MASVIQAQPKFPAYGWLIMSIFWLLMFSLTLWNDLSSPRYAMSLYRKLMDFGLVPFVAAISFAAYYRVRSAEKSAR